MSTAADMLIPGLLRASLVVSVSAVLVALCIRVLRGTTPRAEQWAWLCVLLQGLLITPVLIPLPASWNARPTEAVLPTEAPAETAATTATVQSQTDAVSPGVAIAELPAPQSMRHASAAAPESVPLRRPAQFPRWSVVALTLWAIGLAGIVGHGIYHYWRFIRRLRDVRAPQPEWNDECLAALRKAGVTAAVELQVADDVGPALCRLPRRLLVIVPESLWTELPAAERLAVLRHEAEHIRRGDLWWSLFARLLAAVHWFNPCAWWAAANFDAQAEFACDLAAAGDHRLQFADLLLRLGVGSQRQPTGIKAIASGRMYERIRRLISGSAPTSHWRAATPPIIALLVAFSAAIRFEATASLADDQPAVDAVADAPSLPERAVTRLGKVSFATRDFPTDIAFTPDNRHVAAAEANSPAHIVRIFDVATGLEVTKLSDPESGYGSLDTIAFSPDGIRMAGGDDGGRLIIWDVAQQRVLFREVLLDDRVAQVAFSPNGELIAVSGSRGALQLRSAANPSRVVRELQSGPAEATEFASNMVGSSSGTGAIAFTADGGKLICANRATGTVLVWNVSAGTLLYTFNAVEGRSSPLRGPSLISVALTSDGKSIFTSGHRTVPRDETTLAFGPKNVWIPQNRLWDLETGRIQRDLSDEHEYGVGAAALLPDGERFVMQLYDEIVLRTFDDLRVQQRLGLNGEFGGNLTLSPDGRTLALQLGGCLAVFDVETGQRIHGGERAGMDHVMSADWSRSADRIATAGKDGNVNVWEAKSGELLWSRPLAPYIKPAGRVSRPSFVKLDDRWQRVIAAGERDDSKLWRCGTVTIFNAATGQVREDLAVPKPILMGAMAPNSRTAVFAGSHGGIGETQLYGVDLDTLAVKFVAPSDNPDRGLWQVEAMEFLPDSSAFRVATGDCQIIEFDAESGEQLRTFSIDWRTEEQRAANEPKLAQLWEGSFAPGAALLASSSAEYVYLWDAATGEQKLRLEHPHKKGCRLTISPDSQMIATSDMQYAGDYGDDTIRFYDTSGKELITLNPGDARANVLTFSPDGTKLLTGFFSQPPVIWDVR